MKKPSIISLFIVLIIICLGSYLHAHEVRPAYLNLRQTGVETFDVLWKVPARGNLRLSLNVRFPDNCQRVTPCASYQSVDAFAEHYTLLCPGGLAGCTISIDGLSATLTDVLVRLERADGTIQMARLTPSSPSFIVEAVPGRMQSFATYLVLGVEHILLGIDHLLFVLSLLIIVKGWRRLIGTISAFTIAHSITLAVATLGLVHVPQQPVEAVIALSIVFVAGECVHSMKGRGGITERWPWVVAFIFGLLHGFGFAGALSEVGLPQKDIPVALLSFNIGVEIGQLAFIAGVVVLGNIARRIPIVWPRWAIQIPAYGIGSIASFWTIERVVGFCL